MYRTPGLTVIRYCSRSRCVFSSPVRSSTRFSKLSCAFWSASSARLRSAQVWVKPDHPDFLTLLVKENGGRDQDGNAATVLCPQDALKAETLPPRLRISRTISFARSSLP